MRECIYMTLREIENECVCVYVREQLFARTYVCKHARYLSSFLICLVNMVHRQVARP